MQKAWMPVVGLGALSAAGCLTPWYTPPPAGIVRELLPPAANPPGPVAESLPVAPATRAGKPPAPLKTTGTLELTDVLQSVDQGFPLLLAIHEERTIASGQRLAAEGFFDTNVSTRNIVSEGTYSNNRVDVLVEQALPMYGISVFGGYRKSSGDFPSYYGDRKTAEAGELRGGFMLPVLRNGPIDRGRASLRQAQISENLADPVIQAARIGFLRAGAVAYWSWVAAGERYHVEDALLKLARDRQEFIDKIVKAGNRPELEAIDNRRSIAEREGRLIAAERSLQQAAITLSLYYRDSEGHPVVPGAQQLPSNLRQLKPMQPKSELIKQDIETAFVNRPEMNRFALLKERVAIDLQLAENSNLPTLNGALLGSQELGKGKPTAGSPFDEGGVEASFLLSMPLQFRQARGEQQRYRGILMQLQMQEQFQRENIGAEVQDAVSSLDRAYARILRARDEADIAARVVSLEKKRFEEGAATVLEVNLRELAAADAQRRVVDALADYFRATADYRAALGLDASQPLEPQAK
ncbi:MAG: TolC family protein [Gemmatales bacterium]